MGQALLIYSFKTSKLHMIKYLAGEIFLMEQLSLLMAPNQTLVKNFTACFGILVAIMIMGMVIVSHLLCQISNSKYVLPFIVANLLAFGLIVIFKTREGDEIVQEVLWYIGSESCIFCLITLFVRINQDTALASTSNRMQLFELEQYYDIFNCLQEGVIVFDRPIDQQSDHRVFFANEIMQSIMKQVLKADQFDLLTVQAALNQPIFYPYRSDISANGQRQIPEHPSFSFN